MVDARRLLAKVNQIAELLLSPDVPGQMHHAQMLAVSISQDAPSGVIAEVALKVVAALGTVERFPDAPEFMVVLDTALRSLRAVLEAFDGSKDS